MGILCKTLYWVLALLMVGTTVFAGYIHGRHLHRKPVPATFPHERGPRPILSPRSHKLLTPHWTAFVPEARPVNPTLQPHAHRSGRACAVVCPQRLTSSVCHGPFWKCSSGATIPASNGEICCALCRKSPQ